MITARIEGVHNSYTTMQRMHSHSVQEISHVNLGNLKLHTWKLLPPCRCNCDPTVLPYCQKLRGLFIGSALRIYCISAQNLSSTV